MNPTATTAHAPATQKAPEDPGRSSVPGETALSAAEHGTPSLGNHALLETQMGYSQPNGYSQQLEEPQRRKQYRREYIKGQGR